MHKMLLPFDGSENALRALDYAIRRAKGAAATSIHLVHAHEEPLIYGEIAVYVSREKMSELQRGHSEGVLAPAEQLLKEAGVAYTKEVIIGPMAESP